MADLKDRKVTLIAQLDSHRKQLSLSGHRIQGRLNAMRRFKESFAAYPWAWIGAAAIIGVILTRRRTPKVRVKRTSKATETSIRAGIGLGALKLLFDLLRPVLITQLSSRISGIASDSRGSKRDR